MANEVVKYQNDLNTATMRTWTEKEMNILFSIVDGSGNNYQDNNKVYVSFQARNTLNIFSNSNKVSELEIPSFSRQSDSYNIDKDIYLMGNSKDDIKLIIPQSNNH